MKNIKQFNSIFWDLFETAHFQNHTWKKKKAFAQSGVLKKTNSKTDVLRCLVATP